MVQSVDIVNNALLILGNQPITSMDEQSQPARVMRGIYEGTLISLLANYRWRFAMKRALLPMLESKPLFEYAHAYRLPTDYLALVKVNDIWFYPNMKPLWSIEGSEILSDLKSPLRLRYIAKVEDPMAFDPAFKEAFEYALAVKSCDAITQSNTKKQILMQEYQAILQKAVYKSAIERAPDKIPQGSWLDARETYSGCSYIDEQGRHYG